MLSVQSERDTLNIGPGQRSSVFYDPQKILNDGVYFETKYGLSSKISHLFVVSIIKKRTYDSFDSLHDM
ncbi:hypothetical protein CYV19_02920 [Natronobacterium gregoryi SP2]|uniref:Uncharacterized protein n=1 Tax=Natronobacterium gregoryi (strain ATCC 43098 / DSM 3393 / CCM 3738 / CIP 104747 / IAM 13177 / JCM 8860 / NBRC 102187 / NCIMB 2189 / SP2) TaxID=797304 RepID=L9YDX2_NATGS|nr:hypothetical protein C490_04002 [Natronobacterium gregoryi SP2]PLK21799.1 hypothetical protein CYV19_02920 [Natronobacterium gregoryi SP2]